MKTETENRIIAVEGGYRVANGNAQSVQVYPSWKSAVDACKADIQSWKDAKTAEEAEWSSPVEWE